MADKRLETNVASCIAKGGPVRSRQFLDVDGTVCPFSMWYEIERAVKRKPEETTPCPHIGPQELKERTDKKTIWHYRKCYYEINQQGR